MNPEFFDVLREEYIKPITSVLYPEYGGATLDSHKVFVVKYRLGEDEDLACHFDNAEVGNDVADLLNAVICDVNGVGTLSGGAAPFFVCLF